MPLLPLRHGPHRLVPHDRSHHPWRQRRTVRAFEHPTGVCAVQQRNGRRGAWMTTQCKRCGGYDIAANGRCRPCDAARAAAYRCSEVGRAYVKQYNSSPAARENRKRYADKVGTRRHLRNKPPNAICSICESSNWNKSGKCRTCDAARAKAKRLSNPEFREQDNIRRKASAARMLATRTPETALLHKRRSFEKHIRRTFGLTPEDWARMCNAQGGRCAGCGDQFTARSKVVVDHCHATGRVRGLLCHYCNCTIGYASDSVSRLRGLIEYLHANGVLEHA